MLEQITPLVLTYNEEANIGRNLHQLGWARDIVLVDSFSTDETVEIARQFPQVRVFQRRFDSHQNQWAFGLKNTQIKTPWVLALDADYILPDNFVGELQQLEPPRDVSGYAARFIYCVAGKRLRSGIYPPVVVLYRRDTGHYEQDGHAQKLRVSGEVRRLREPLLHDDRKSLMHWCASQARYAELEAIKLRSVKTGELSVLDRVRCWHVVAPPAILLYCLFVRRGIFDGWAGLHYAYERTIAELMLSLQLLGERVRPRTHVITPVSDETTSVGLPETHRDLTALSAKF